VRARLDVAVHDARQVALRNQLPARARMTAVSVITKRMLRKNTDARNRARTVSTWRMTAAAAPSEKRPAATMRSNSSPPVHCLRHAQSHARRWGAQQCQRAQQHVHACAKRRKRDALHDDLHRGVVLVHGVQAHHVARAPLQRAQDAHLRPRRTKRDAL
jgi:hypothetical protein